MKEIKMFMLEHCPHCKKARTMMDEIFAAHPEYKDIPFRMIDEGKEPNYANQFDYHYVPTFYVSDEKMHEGVPAKEAIEKVFAEAYR